MGSKTIRDWLKELRAPFFSATIWPVLLGTAVARSEGNPFLGGWLALALASAVLINAGINLTNDYFDHRRGGTRRTGSIYLPSPAGAA